jgi:hypothetical protein
MGKISKHLETKEDIPKKSMHQKWNLENIKIHSIQQWWRYNTIDLLGQS